MAFDLDDEELKATRKLLGIDKENNIKGYCIQNGELTLDNPAEIRSLDIEETKKNIEYWENEVQKALKENDINKAIGCRILANNLRKDIGEESI